MWDAFSESKASLQIKIEDLMNDIANWFKNLPQKIYDAIISVPGKISGAAARLFQMNKGGLVRESMAGAGAGGGGGGSFQLGGLVGGGLSRAVPIMAHGREMILNMTQQSRLFNLLNEKIPLLATQPATNNGGVTYHVEIKTGMMVASPGEQRAFARYIENFLRQENRRRGPEL
jgi:hypothetical protein